MENEILTFLEENEQAQIKGQGFYGFKDHWRECRDLLNVHFRKLKSTHDAITRKEKRSITFQKSFENRHFEPWGIPYKEVSVDYVKEVLSIMLHDDFQPPWEPEPLAEQIKILYLCLSYFSKNLDYLPLSAQMRLDYILMEISNFVGGMTSAGVSVALKYDYELSRINKGNKTVRERRDTEDKPIIIECLKTFLKTDKEVLESFSMEGACKIIAKKSGFSLSKVKPIVKEYYEETGITPPFKKMKQKVSKV